MIINTQHSNMLISPARTVVGKVELYKGSTLSQTFSHTDALSGFTLHRAGDKKFFGFGISQELELKLVDRERAINIIQDDILKVSFGVEGTYVYPAPLFYVSADIKRDENTNQLTIKAYDMIHKAKSHTVAELNLIAPYTIDDVAAAVAAFFGLTISKINVNDNSFSTSYPTGANFDGAETLREVLDAIAGATQTIYYIDANNNLVFKRLDMGGDAVLTIGKADYFTLESKTNRILSDICSATELGDNVIISAPGITGETQYVRDNPFWELREDITTLLEAAIAAVGGLSLNQFTCKWRGNYLVEPGDKINIATKDNGIITSYLLDDKYVYTGGFSSDTTWEYAENSGESADNPTTIGGALKQTFAKVDKVNKQVEIVASETEANSSEISSLKLDTKNINMSVQQVEQITSSSLEVMNENIETLTTKVNSTMTAEEVQLQVQTELANGVDKVITTTGFTFNEEGLHINKTGSEITTTITEDGMTVLRENDEVLVADNLGVKAEDLHATTFLIIGNNSRFEDYEGSRTGCFYIGNI